MNAARGELESRCKLAFRQCAPMRVRVRQGVTKTLLGRLPVQMFPDFREAQLTAFHPPRFAHRSLASLISFLQSRETWREK